MRKSSLDLALDAAAAAETCRGLRRGRLRAGAPTPTVVQRGRVGLAGAGIGRLEAD